MSTRQDQRAAGAPIAPTALGEAPGGFELSPGVAVQGVADRLAALTARAAGTPTAMLHLAEGSSMRVVGGCDLPDGFVRMGPVPTSSTLAGQVIHTGLAVVVEDVHTDPRVPPGAPLRAVGIRAYAGFPIRDPGGAIVGVCAVADYRPRRWTPAELSAVDDGAQACTALVGERSARNEVERQRRFLDTLLDSLDTGVLACDAHGRLLVVNRSMRDRLGVEPAEQPPPQWLATLPVRHPDGRPFTCAEVPLIQALTGQPVHGVEHLAVTLQGARRRYSVNAHPITGPTGQSLGAVSMFHDVTERRRAERFRGCELAVTLALNEAHSLDEAAPRILAGVAGTLDWPCAELWLVQPALDGELLHRIEQYGVAEDPRRPAAPPRLQPGQSLTGIAWQRAEPVWRTDLAATGDPVPAAATASRPLHTGLALPVSSGERTLAVLTVFTDQREECDDAAVNLLSGIATHIGQFIERRRAEELQHALTASKDEYLHLVGHELRTPLTVIASAIELLADAGPATTLADVATMTTAIRRNSDRLRRLVDALLDLSGLDSGQSTICRAPVDLPEIINAAVEQHRAAADARHHDITTDLPPHLQTTADRQRLTQMFAELIGNAVTYTAPGGRIDIRLRHHDHTAELTVTDTGPGIPAEEQSHIFQRFYRGHIATEQAIPGAGLGLPIAQLIARRHHGEIALMPTPTGTSFRVRLPT